MENKLKRGLNYLGIIALVYLLYLNLLVPLTISFKQVFPIALEVVKISNERGIGLAIISPHQLDQLIYLSITTVKQVFKKRIIPNMIESTLASEWIPYHRPGVITNGVTGICCQIIDGHGF